MRKWKENEEMERDSLFTFPHFLFISFIKKCLILSHNVKSGTFVANITKNLTRAMRKQFWVELAARNLCKL